MHNLIDLCYYHIQCPRKESNQRFLRWNDGASGYQFGGDNPYNLDICSPTFGIGGCAKLYLTKHFRTGFEGYFSTAPISKGVQSGSHNKLFWTGILADWYWQKGKFVPYVGTTIGGGMETSFYLFEGDKHDWELEQKSVLHKQPFFAIDPYVGIEYVVGKHSDSPLRQTGFLQSSISVEGV